MSFRRVAVTAQGAVAHVTGTQLRELMGEGEPDSESRFPYHSQWGGVCTDVPASLHPVQLLVVPDGGTDGSLGEAVTRVNPPLEDSIYSQSR
jgi:hypothetical protein